MYGLWWQQYLAITQANSRLLAAMYGGWALPPVGGKTATGSTAGEPWLQQVDVANLSVRRTSVVNCAAGLYCAHSVNIELLIPANG